MTTWATVRSVGPSLLSRLYRSWSRGLLLISPRTSCSSWRLWRKEILINAHLQHMTRRTVTFLPALSSWRHTCTISLRVVDKVRRTSRELRYSLFKFQILTERILVLRPHPQNGPSKLTSLSCTCQRCSFAWRNGGRPLSLCKLYSTTKPILRHRAAAGGHAVPIDAVEYPTISPAERRETYPLLYHLTCQVGRNTHWRRPGLTESCAFWTDVSSVCSVWHLCQ